jgi:hypothetical protein
MAKLRKTARSNNDFNLVFEGDMKALDVNILTSTLLNFNSVIQEINREQGNENAISIQIKSFKSGGFDISCSIAADPGVSNTLFGAANNAAEISGAVVINALTDILATKEFLGSKKPKSIKSKDDHSIVIKNSEGKTKAISTKTGHLVFNNSVINGTLNAMFQLLHAMPQMEGLVLKDGEGKKKFKAKRNQFKRLANSTVERKKKTEQKVPKPKVNLSIHKLVFGTNNSWEFYYEGNKISAIISDEKFHKKMLNGQIEFINGDVMIADLEITQEFNELANVFENKKYTVTRVHDVKHLPAQSALNFIS